MTIYCKPDWNEIIEEFYLVITKIWEADLATEDTLLIISSFSDCVLRNAPNQAEELLYKLQIKT